MQKYQCFGVLLSGRYLFEILHNSSTVKTSWHVVKSGYFLKLVPWRAQSFCWNEGAVPGVLCKSIFAANLLEILYLFDILQTFFTVKNS